MHPYTCILDVNIYIHQLINLPIFLFTPTSTHYAPFIQPTVLLCSIYVCVILFSILILSCSALLCSVVLYYAHYCSCSVLFCLVLLCHIRTLSVLFVFVHPLYSPMGSFYCPIFVPSLPYSCYVMFYCFLLCHVLLSYVL